MKKKVVAVSEVNKYVSRLLEEDYILSDIWISGEVSNCKYHHSGHIYFTIKDEGASISAVMFARDAKNLDFTLQEGTKIYARARISIYQKTGVYQSYISEIELQGMGILYEKFEKLKVKLQQEGLFENHYKKAIPQFPKKVGVITSQTGAAIKDILQVANRRNASIPVYIYPSHVQGEYAKDELVACIAQANKDKLVDVIIVGRGGGSIEDLWPFNEEKVARAIFDSKIPIVSAVGHEVDFTIADFVSDLRAATPSAAAEIIFPSKEEYLEMVQRYEDSLKYMVYQKIKRGSERLDYLLSRPVYANKRRYFDDLMIGVDDLSIDLQKAYKNKLQLAYKEFEDKVNQLEKLSPLSTLKRGYSLVTTEDDKVITSLKDIKVGEMVEVMVADGKFKAKVDKKG
ncbi:MAG: exodeoxyribonuclease VII large subunit [Cellulosilyticaceae bacterium]